MPHRNNILCLRFTSDSFLSLLIQVITSNEVINESSLNERKFEKKNRIIVLVEPKLYSTAFEIWTVSIYLAIHSGHLHIKASTWTSKSTYLRYLPSPLRSPSTTCRHRKPLATVMAGSQEPDTVMAISSDLEAPPKADEMRVLQAWKSPLGTRDPREDTIRLSGNGTSWRASER